jgi:putative DNA primase/helicase
MSADTTWGIGTRDEDRQKLESSAVSAEVADERGYRSVQDHAQLKRARFSQSQRQRVPGLLIPLHNVLGGQAGYQYRPDQPRQRGGKPVKYETRADQLMVLDVPPRTQPQLRDPSVPLWITEGPLKADSAVTAGLCCVALLGVWNWRGTNDVGGKTVLADFEHIAFNGREVVVAFDSDAWTKRSVYDGAKRLAGMLESRGADVAFLRLPDDGHGKTGLDDYLAAHGPDGLEALVSDEIGDRPESAKDAPVGLDGLHLTELGNAHRLISAHGDEVRYVPAWKTWLRWDGVRWMRDHDSVRVAELATDVPRRMWDEVADASGVDTKVRNAAIGWARKSESSNAITATVRLARTMPGVAVSHDQLDAEPGLFNATNHTIDLVGRWEREHRPGDLLTKVAGAAWRKDADAPTWEAFLAEVLPDAEVRDYVQRAVGYCLSGDVSEQVMFLLIGEGANGKSTFISAIENVLGDYAGIAAKDLLVSQRHDPHPTSMADLFGVRLAVGVETEQTDTLAESKVKQLTGGDKIKARRMREDFWEYTPTHKLWLATNFLPRIRGRDHAMWRRLRVIPFSVTIPEDRRDGQLPAKLAAEADGILRWAIEGHHAWRDRSLKPPAAVVEAVDEYKASQDWFAAFIEDAELELSKGMGQIDTSVLVEKYRSWCRDDGRPHLSRQEFAQELQAHGCVAAKSNGKRVWKGIWSVASTEGEWS